MLISGRPLGRVKDARRTMTKKEEGIVSKKRGHMNWIELRHPRYFTAAVQYGIFRKAIEALGVEQSAISRRIRDLEFYIGAQLYQRSNAGVHLTIAGERFLRRARRALRHIEEDIGDANAIERNESSREGQLARM